MKSFLNNGLSETIMKAKNLFESIKRRFMKKKKIQYKKCFKNSTL